MEKGIFERKVDLKEKLRKKKLWNNEDHLNWYLLTDRWPGPRNRNRDYVTGSDYEDLKQELAKFFPRWKYFIDQLNGDDKMKVWCRASDYLERMKSFQTTKAAKRKISEYLEELNSLDPLVQNEDASEKEKTTSVNLKTMFSSPMAYSKMIEKLEDVNYARFDEQGNPILWNPPAHGHKTPSKYLTALLYLLEKDWFDSEKYFLTKATERAQLLNSWFELVGFTTTAKTLGEHFKVLAAHPQKSLKDKYFKEILDDFNTFFKP